MKQEYALKEHYKNYLRGVRKLSEASVKHYVGGLSAITKILQEKGKIKDSIYEINGLQELGVVKDFLRNDADFLLKDSVGHNMYSAALNNYIRFAQGDDFFTATYSFSDLDKPVEASEPQIVEESRYKRSSIIKTQSIKAAHFMCEADKNHVTFTAKSSNKQYMEAHHLIPITNQKEFEFSLDIYANIVSLCPICHRLLHYGIEKEKRILLEQLYDDRYIRLCNSGIEISKNGFLELTMG